MKIFSGLLAMVAVLNALVAGAAEQPAAGKFLVASEDAAGTAFEKTVILLLHYDELGAQGLVINRKSDADLGDVFPGSEMLAGYAGPLFWGGPVRMTTMRALLRSDEPPEDAVALVADVYQVALDADLRDYALDDAYLRFYVGYAGWSPGQLDSELRFGHWDVVVANGDAVFSSTPGTVWQSLRPAQQYRAQRTAVD